MYRVEVAYKTYEGWSQAYTYKSKIPYIKGTAVVVPTGTFYSAAKVLSCKESSDFPKNIAIRYVIGSIEELKNLNKEN